VDQGAGGRQLGPGAGPAVAARGGARAELGNLPPLVTPGAGQAQVKMVKPGARPITLPQHKGRTYSKGLDAAIWRQAGL
jgi:hypothetical protein